MPAWPKIYRYKECPDCGTAGGDGCWSKFLAKQRERAGEDLGYYDTGPISRLNVDQMIALLMMCERAFVAHDQWDRNTADLLIVNLAHVDRDTFRPDRKLDDELDGAEAWILWQALGARAEVLDVFCECDAGGRNFRGVCPPDTWTYAPTRTAQLRRLTRLGLATQRVLKPIKPPPVLNPIGELLRLAGWGLLIYLVATEERN